MSTITGKIYQQTNAAGTENRFPRTVMEAVLGLNSYLQNQFSALADIYMPIEGINQAKPNQEFVYRKTPNTIKAKALTLDKIKGKTLAWNQLAPAFTDTTRWITGGDAETRTATSITIECTSAYSGPYLIGLNTLSSHKYCFRFIASNSSTKRASCEFGGDINYSLSIEAGESNQRHAVIASANSNYIRWYYGSSPYGTIKLEYFSITDLTLLYGSEIDGMTDAEILAKFESEYPGYHANNPGSLISNDAESLESVGFNLWDEEVELGDITDGLPDPSSIRLRSKNFCICLPNTQYYAKGINGGNIWWYDANQNYISYNTISVDGSVNSPGNACYFKINLPAQYGTTYNHDICINLSDPSRNGQYEPYKKSVCPLNLNKIRVISPNIWDEEWEIGYWGGAGAANNLKCKDFIPVQPSTDYYITAPYGFWVGGFDKDKQSIGGLVNWANNGASFTTPSNCYYIAFYIYSEGITTYANNICINLSDPAFNGRYFPHGVLTIEGGLKGAGSVYDEIRGGKKHHKRTGRGVLDGVNIVPISYELYNGYYFANFGNVFPDIEQGTRNIRSSEGNESGEQPGSIYAAGGSTVLIVFPRNQSITTLADYITWLQSHPLTLDYELANEEVYDLAEPIPMSMPAGTTEASISPNADGLSAPFCADMTYGMGATEYAETAGVASFALNTQYAEVAARLLTPRTIWGQVFDGSANVSGAMSGVTNIDSLLNFDVTNSRIGIGISTPQYSLDVAGTFRAAGNSLIGGTLGVTGKLTGNTAQFESVKPSPTEYDSEHSINIPLWRLEEDGEAEFGNTYIRGLLKLRAFYQDDGTFHDATMQYEYDDEDASNCFISADKSIHAPSFVQSSDARLKTNLSPVALTVEQIASAPAVEFNWVGNGQRGAGSIAQYWEEQLPYNVHHNGDLLTMEYGNIALISAIVCARKIQELEEQVKKLEAKINVQS